MRDSYLLWATVTVALFHLSSSAMGVPTILLLPTTTATLPSTYTQSSRSFVKY